MAERKLCHYQQFPFFFGSFIKYPRKNNKVKKAKHKMMRPTGKACVLQYLKYASMLNPIPMQIKENGKTIFFLPFSRLISCPISKYELTIKIKPKTPCKVSIVLKVGKTTAEDRKIMKLEK